MKRWIGIALTLVVFLVGWSVWLWQSFVTVLPGQQAVVERDSGVEVLEAGSHIVSPFGATVTLYDVLFERQHVVGAPLMVEGCAVALLLTYNVGDVLAFHEAGGDFGAMAARDAEVVAVARTADLSLRAPMAEALAELRAEVQAVAPAGLEILRVAADLRGCPAEAVEPVSPPPEIVREAMALVQSDAPLGEIGAEIFELELLSRDDARMTLSGAVATFDVVNAEQAEACFGTIEERAGLRVERVVAAGLRDAAGTHARANVPEAFAALELEFGADCGLRIGPVDFSGARLEWIRAAP